jgi:uncharacterized protein with ACT and thioredoxin-like domain
MAGTINSYLMVIGTFLAAIWMGAITYKDRHNASGRKLWPAVQPCFILL